MSKTVIEAKNLSKEFKDLQRKSFFRDLFSRDYKKVKALNRVNLKIERGEFVGVIGPNGAGKSTMIKILTGILTPTSGYSKVLGLKPYENRKENAKNIGVVFGWRTQLWWDLMVKDSFDLLKHLYKIPEYRFRENLEMFSSILEIDKYMKKPVRKLSLGERVRCDIAASLLHDPEIVFLDEPTIGLDIVAKQKTREFLTKINKERKVTIIITTHDMGDIEELCERIVIIDKGKKIYDGLVDDIKKRFGTERVLIVDFKKDVSKKDLKWKGVRFLDSEADKVFLGIDTKKTSVSGVITKILSKWPIYDISIEEPKIEDIIRKIYCEGI
ncbi:MAG: ATP-binding cassette domain-containing protein [Candidatus Aenigmatarchaeota archaeon]